MWRARALLWCGMHPLSVCVTYFARLCAQALVVCPKIMLQTWKAEFNRFAPALSVDIFREMTGAGRAARVQIMTYGEVLRNQGVELHATDVVRCIHLLLLLLYCLH